MRVEEDVPILLVHGHLNLIVFRKSETNFEMASLKPKECQFYTEQAGNGFFVRI